MLDATAALGRVDLAARGLVGTDRLGGRLRRPRLGRHSAGHENARWRAPYPIDDYQGGRWPGVPDVPAIYAATVALDWWLRSAAASANGSSTGRPVARRIAETVTDVDVAGDPVRRVPQLLTFSALYVDGETLTLELDKAGFAVASGSACSARRSTLARPGRDGGPDPRQRPDRADPDHDSGGDRSVPRGAAADRGPDPRDGRRVVTRPRHLRGCRWTVEG